MNVRPSILAIASGLLLALYGFAQSNPASKPPKLPYQTASPNASSGPANQRTPGEQPVNALQAPLTTGGPKPDADATGSPAKKDDSPWTISLVVSILSLAVSGYTAFYLFGKNYELNRAIAERTVTIEAQKLLLEINKQFVSCPDLFAIYDDYPGRHDLLVSEPKLLPKLRAIAYMHLNVFEIVFAVLPRGTSRKTWVKYFEDSLNRCSLLHDELNVNPEIYHADLIAAYISWRNSHPAGTTRIIQGQEQTPST
jgi:hypothetical protein